MDDYDVEDDLPHNVTTPAAMARLNGRQQSKSNAKEDHEEGKASRKPRPKLDFNRLLKGSRGLGYLAVCTKKSLKLSGKPGGEANDLSQISVYLQEWAKLVFPKMPLMEFLLKVEEICQSRVMKACVPQILARIKEMGENVDLRDLEQVESEVMTKIAATEAERAMESISAGFESQSQQTPAATAVALSKKTTDNDFDLEESLKLNRFKRAKIERTESIDSIEERSEDDDEDSELDEFINDNDSSEKDLSGDDEEDEDSASSSESESFKEKDSLKSKKGMGITFNFDDDSESDNETAVEPAAKDKEDVVKRKSAPVIMNSEDDE